MARHHPVRRGGNPRQALGELWPGQSVALLKALHILTREGAINADSRRKLKQVLHLAQLIKPAIDAAFAEKEQPVLADLGAGKSYLGFILYDLYFARQGRGTVYGVEARHDLIETSKKIAAESGFTRMRFLESAIADARLPDGRADIVTALHACDTATDEAIQFALRHDAKFIALVPCCQAEVAAALEGSKKPERQLWRHPIQRREFGAHLTNVMRGLFLEAHGYKVRVTELTGLEHSLKNEFIFAERHQLTNSAAKAEYQHLADQFGVAPKLLPIA
ncbi:MAG: SAM-dependent methyltransferase [Alphaproteobacteria bacterium]|nr:SAM-dependent methyltransferase [Alphaproteobacteria bacterium]MBL6939023.1 SAM-dependent methyltransferase [Alphaproteobacteria bacterium]MBL7099615.1 SAM-dependent methyltransferase [Alphaproteobacteria bacterium]